ncbi:MAG: SCO family protein [Acidiferrobacterales bacterium]
MRRKSNATCRTRWFAAVSLMLLAALTACSRPKPWSLDNISGIMPPLEFTLTNDAGHTVTASDYRGKLVLLYFGYTHCRDVCPATLAILAQAIHGLGKDAAKVQVLFVTVDPARDTAIALHQYVHEFGPEFVGLRGSDEALTALAKRYHIAYAREKPDARGNYSVTHSSLVFVFDGTGKARLLATSTDTAATIGHDLRRLFTAG